MESKGFEIFYNEDINMMDQIKSVTEAECIVGIVGSNFLNAMYADKGTQQIIFYPDKSQDWLIYSNQSARWDHEVKNIYTDNNPESMIEYLETTESPIIKKWFQDV
jgi:capsular polysaccharide biosynthesis protein